VLAAFSIVIGLSVVDEAAACTPLDPSWSVYEQAPDVIPLGGAIPFTMNGVETTDQPTRVDGITITVRDESDTVVEGATRVLPLRGHEPGSYSRDWLVAWRPTNAWTAGASYTLDVDISSELATDPRRSDLTHTFSVRETNTEPSAGEIVEQTLGVDERTVREDCCDVPDCMRNCVNDCRRCWPTEFAYQPVLTNTVAIPDTIWASQLLLQHNAAPGYTRVSAGSEALINTDTELVDREFCAAPRVILIWSENELSGESKCVPASELPEYDERDASEEFSAPSACDADDRADAGGANHDAGPDGGASFGPDVESDILGEVPDDGCSQGSAGVASPLAIALLLCLVGARARRRHA
jgi:hypothetical protein